MRPRGGAAAALLTLLTSALCARSHTFAAHASIFLFLLTCTTRSDIGRLIACLVCAAQEPEGRAALLSMLAGADVLITNVRVSALQRLGLDYEQLRDSCPQLVFAHVTAWGREGPDTELAGFDIGAFWSASGIAHAVHGPCVCMCAGVVRLLPRALKSSREMVLFVLARNRPPPTAFRSPFTGTCTPHTRSASATWRQALGSWEVSRWR